MSSPFLSPCFWDKTICSAFSASAPFSFLSALVTSVPSNSVFPAATKLLHVQNPRPEMVFLSVSQPPPHLQLKVLLILHLSSETSHPGPLHMVSCPFWILTVPGASPSHLCAQPVIIPVIVIKYLLGVCFLHCKQGQPQEDRDRACLQGACPCYIHRT